MMTTNKRIGLVQVISADELKIITYALDSYELAKLQAKELLKGVTAPITLLPELNGVNNCLRQTGYLLPTLYELVMIMEVEIGTSVLSVK